MDVQTPWYPFFRVGQLKAAVPRSVFEVSATSLNDRLAPNTHDNLRVAALARVHVTAPNRGSLIVLEEIPVFAASHFASARDTDWREHFDLPPLGLRRLLLRQILKCVKLCT
jgi:hypothetical protein